eukprot:UN0618
MDQAAKANSGLVLTRRRHALPAEPKGQSSLLPNITGYRIRNMPRKGMRRAPQTADQSPTRKGIHEKRMH